jgi:hypothetical protein
MATDAVDRSHSEKEFKSAHRSVACDAPNQGKILVTPEDEHLIEFAINNAGQV